jgi:hypothetical protein
VVDSVGAVVPGAVVTAVSADGKEKSATTDKGGQFNLTGLQPGTYTIKATAANFAPFENPDVEIKAGRNEAMTLSLSIATVTEQVEVGGNTEVNTDPNNNASATVLKDKDLDALPDDPDELQQALQAMAGPAAGPDGGQIMIDGFTGGQMPPKEAIREVRINQNPFSAEYDRVGFNRIEILTKPGFDKIRGQAYFNFNDESLNSRNPFALNKASSQVRNFGGFLSGPIKAKKASYFVDVNSNSNDQNAVVAATILDPSANIVNFNEDVLVPTRRFSISPRIDYAINDRNTLVARYSFNRFTADNRGIGGFSLPTRGTTAANTQHTVQLTETAILNAKTVNETRLQLDFSRNDQNGDNSIPTINVSGAFIGGGAQVGTSFNNSNRFELQNYTTTSFGKNSQHTVKFGVRMRGVSIKDQSESNYGGSYVFTGVPFDSTRPLHLMDGTLVTRGLTSIEQYQQKVLGNTDERFNPNQFSITTGNPLATVKQFDYGIFATDDWKVRQDLTLSLGLRYENQTNIHSDFNFAPRVGFAWAPGPADRKLKTVIRGGFGIFYDRFGENFTLRENRQNGISQPQYFVSTNQFNILGQAVFTPNGVTNVPTAEQLALVAPRSSIPFTIADDLSSPYSMQTALSVEQSLPKRTVFSATFAAAKSIHVLRTRNINAPVCPNLAACPDGLGPAEIAARRPDPTQGNIYQVESSGYSNTRMLMLQLRSNLTPGIMINGGYSLSFANGDTDSLSSPRFAVNTVGFPAYSYDLSNEYAPSAFNARHSVFVVGSFTMPWGIRANPMIIASTGRPFNITTGLDTNYDSIFFERPTYTQLANVCRDRGLNAPYCDISGISNPDTTVIPRNYGRGPGSFVMNLNLSKTFGFGGKENAAAGGQTAGGSGRGGRGGGGRGGMGGGPMGGFFGGGETRKPYNLTFGVNFRNIFNTVNLSSPVGNLNSPNFGKSLSTGGGFGFFGGGDGGSANRRIDLSVRFSF